jgi:hypothetical protein
VDHVGFDDLATAVAEMRRRALEIRAQGPASPVSVVREFSPADQVQARLQLTGKGWLRKPIAGVDLRGDGTFMPYRGGIGREELDPTEHDSPFDAVRAVLEQPGGGARVG